MKVSFKTLRLKYCFTPDEAQAGQLSIHAKVEKKCFGLFKLEASTFLQSGASSKCHHDVVGGASPGCVEADGQV